MTTGKLDRWVRSGRILEVKLFSPWVAGRLLDSVPSSSVQDAVDMHGPFQDSEKNAWEKGECGVRCVSSL